MRRRLTVLLAIGAMLSVGITAASGARPLSAQFPRSKASAAPYKETFCASDAPTCLDPYSSIGPNGEYTGHDEPSTIFRSNHPGSGNNMTYVMTLPKDPPKVPQQNGKGGTWNFELRPTFWLGLTMCDTQSAPEFTRTCKPDSDTNNKVSTNPNSPNYLGRHPGTPSWSCSSTGPATSPSSRASAAGRPSTAPP